MTEPVTPGRATMYETPPTDAKGTLRRFEHIELEINTACDMTCFACDRFSDVTSGPSMTIKQVALFVDESIELNWKWERIRILGGEPTLHPHFKEIVEEIRRYRRFYPKVFIQVLSNGHGKLKQYRDWLIDKGVDPHVEQKHPGVTPPWFGNTRIAPIDKNPELKIVTPCCIFGLQACGIGLTRHGYFLDGAGASVARVAGHDIGMQSLKEVTWDNMIDQSKILCRLCGHWNAKGDHTINEKVVKTGKVTGPFWTKKLEEFHENRPILKVYGEPNG